MAATGRADARVVEALEALDFSLTNISTCAGSLAVRGRNARLHLVRSVGDGQHRACRPTGAQSSSA